jgi:hypothetical protein
MSLDDGIQNAPLCPLDGNPCEGQGTDAECRACIQKAPPVCTVDEQQCDAERQVPVEQVKPATETVYREARAALEIGQPFPVLVSPDCPPGKAFLLSTVIGENGETRTQAAGITGIGPKTETVYERARKALFAACHRGRLLLSIPLRLDDPDVLISAAIDAGEAAEKRAEEAEKASEANLIALARSNEQLRTGLEMAVNALGHLWSAIGDRLLAQGPLAKEYGQSVARDVNLAREAALRALSSTSGFERERDALKARVKECEAALKAVSTDIAQDALEDPIGHDERKRAGWYRLFEGTMVGVRSALDPPISPDGTDWTPRKPPKEG